MTEAERRTARLHFSAELAAGALDEAALEHPAVRRAARVRRLPPRPLRLLQRLDMKRGRPGFDPAPLAAARRAVLGPAASVPPRFLVRMDEYPHYQATDEPERYGDAAFAPWRDILAAAGCAHLVAVVTRPAQAPLDPRASGDRALAPEERERLAQLVRDGTELAVHGLDHRTRDARPRHHSELAGRAPAELAARLDRADAVLTELAGAPPRVFVPPFNRFDPEQYPLLARRYAVVCGGPESVRELGLHPTPQWRGDAVWLPAYTPLYGTAAQVLPAVERLLAARTGGWVPVVLHWGWEADRGWEDLRRLADRLAPFAAPWGEFLAAVAASRGPLVDPSS